MKLSLRFASLVPFRLVQGLKSLQESLERWVPQPAPALVPIPIRTDRRARATPGRRPYRGG